MSNINVQMHPQGISIEYGEETVDENLPGQLNLTWGEMRSLHSQLGEVMHNRRGLDEYQIVMGQIEVGDIIENLGNLKVINVTHYVVEPKVTRVLLEGHGIHKPVNLILPADQIITVLRPIQ